MNAPVHISDRPEKLRLRVEDFELLEERGAFADRSKAELIDGDIYVLNAQYARHGVAKVRLLYALMKRLEAIGSDLEMFSEVSLRVAPDSMPEPDLFLAPKQDLGPVPTTGVVLVIEVADSTRSTDLGRKAELYAVAGIPEYWVVDLDSGHVLIHHDAQDGRYRHQQEVAFDQPLAAVTVPGIDLGVVRFLA